MNDGKFIMFQDDFYNLLEKYSRNKINCEHKKWNEICKTRNDVANFIDTLKWNKQKKANIYNKKFRWYSRYYFFKWYKAKT